MFKRTISILLAMLILVGATSLLSCSKGDAKTSNQDTVSTSTTEPNEEIDPAKRLDVPDELDYGGKEFVIISWQTTAEYGDVTLSKPSMVEQNLVARDKYLENYLNVKLDVIYQIGDWSNCQNFANAIHNSVFSQSAAYDLITGFSMALPILTINGDLYDMANDTFVNGQKNYVDETKFWWPEYLLDSVRVNDTLYSLSGDASSLLLSNLFVVMADTAELKDNQLDIQTMYSAVDAGEWTIEYMLNTTKNLSKDNGDGIWDANDYYAISAYDSIPFEGLYFSAGLNYIDSKGDRLVISDSIMSERAIDTCEMVRNAMNFEHIIRYTEADKRTLITSGDCIFELGTMAQLGDVIQASESNIAMLPYPKYEAGDAQAYKTLVNTGYSYFGIPGDAKDATMSSAVLETLGYASYTMVTPIIYEKIMKLRYSLDPDSSRMFDIIRAGATQDAVILHQWAFVANSCWITFMYRYAVHESGTFDWVSKCKTYEPTAKFTLNTLNEFYLG